MHQNSVKQREYIQLATGQEISPYVSHRTATTRVAMLDIDELMYDSKLQEKLLRLEQRGYNTVVLPLMQHGRITALPDKKKPGAPLVGLLPKTLAEMEADCETSVWVSIDPLSASVQGDKTLSQFARLHQEWLMRNSNGHSSPIGRKGFSPIFSWINEEYRRYLGDLLVSLAENNRFTGIVLDFRAYPIRCSDPERWYCCSYASQKRVLKELNFPFNDLLQSGTRSEIHQWQRWVYNELTAFVKYLKSRVRVARYDIFWKILVDVGNPHDPEESPWIKWLSTGLIEETLVTFNPTEFAPNAVIEQIDVAAMQGRLILPVFKTEDSLQMHWETMGRSCITGYMVEKPEFDSVKSLPAFQSYWEHCGALEDNPHETCIALSKFLAKRFTRNHRLGRYYERVAKALDEFEPTPEMLGLLIGKLATVEVRLADASKVLEPEFRPLTREMELLVRMLPTIRIKPEVY